MSDLCSSVCEPCRVGAPLLTEEELAELMPQVPEWQVIAVDGIQRVTRSFTFSNFAKALAFTNQVGELAESHGHHPEIVLEWGKVTVGWWTHKIKGLHKNDIIMAAKTEQINL